MAPEEGYDAGKRDARLDVLEATQKHHESRLRLLERIVWGLAGALVLTQWVPDLKALLGG